MSYVPSPPTTTASWPTTGRAFIAATPASERSTDSPHTDKLVTRHLCAGVYLDEDFQRRVLRDVYNQPLRSVAPANGADAAAVAGHAIQARQLSLWQAAALSGLMLLVLFVSPFIGFSVVAILIVWQFLTSAIGLAGQLDASAGGSGRSSVRLPLLVMGGVIAIPLALTMFPLLLASLGLGLDLFSSNSSSAVSAVDWLLPVVGVMILLAGTSAGFALIRRSKIAELRNGVGGVGRRQDVRTERLRNGQSGNVVTYSGYRPFIGAGIQLRTWQFALPLHALPSKEPSAHASAWPHFDTVTLQQHIGRALRKLGSDSASSIRLPGLALADLAFVSGLLTAKPTHTIAELGQSGLPTDIGAISQNPTMPVRHYLQCQIGSWDGELVTTIYVHAALQGETLYMEFTSFVLPPTREDFQVIAEKAQTDAAAVLSEALAGAGQTPRHLVRSPLVIWRWASDSIKANRLWRQWLQPAPSDADHGAQTSVRAMGTDWGVHSYFQTRDAVKYVSILEAQLLDTTVEFLSDKVDVSELLDRAQTIVNNNVTNNGTVYTASQTGPGRVGAMGPQSTPNSSRKS